jgi:hypothetical protein
LTARRHALYVFGTGQRATDEAVAPTIGEQPAMARTEAMPATARFLLVGGLCGLAWSAGLRGLMAEVAGFESTFDWAGTFLWILLPGVIVGMLLGWAEYLRRTGGRRHWRWLALAPFAFAAFLPFEIDVLLEGGFGGGAIAIPLFGIAGGYALAHGGAVWLRIVCGAIAVSPVVAWALVATAVGGSRLALETPRGAWVAVFFYSFVAVSALACSIPFRQVVRHTEESATAAEYASVGDVAR